MGKVSILKSFSLAAAVLSIVGVSTSPAFARVEQAARFATIAASESALGASVGAPGITATDIDIGGYVECPTCIDIVPLPSDFYMSSFVRIPTNRSSVVSDLNKKVCVGDSTCPTVYQTAQGNASSATLQATNTSVPANSLVRGSSLCTNKNTSVNVKGFCRQCSNDYGSGKEFSCTSAAYPKCVNGMCMKTEEAHCNINGTQYHILKNLSGTEVAAGSQTLDTCVECVNNAHCPAGKYCVRREGQSANDSATGSTSKSIFRCVNCYIDAHCSGATPACLTTALNESSKTTPYYQCRECTSNAFCSSKPYNGSGRSCLTSIPSYGTSKAFTCGCTSNSDKTSCGGAGSGYVCDNNKCRVGCAADDDCAANPANKVCNTTDRVCRYPNSAAECSAYLGLPGYAGGLCRVCTTDEHCSGDTPFCDRSSYTCTADCRKADTKTCTSAVGAATPVCQNSSGNCVQCSTSNPTNVGQCSTTKSICSGTSCASCGLSSQCQTYYGANSVCVTKGVPSGGSSGGRYNCGNKICNKPCNDASGICMVAAN